MQLTKTSNISQSIRANVFQFESYRNSVLLLSSDSGLTLSTSRSDFIFEFRITNLSISAVEIGI